MSTAVYTTFGRDVLCIGAVHHIGFPVSLVAESPVEWAIAFPGLCVRVCGVWSD